MQATEMAPALKDWERLADPYRSSEDERKQSISAVVRSVPTLMRLLETMRSLDLPDCWLVSGAIYQTMWNIMTDRPHEHGLKDYDIVYFDGSDLSYEAEDRVIKKVEAALPDLADRIETRNQARVHLWYEKRFGCCYPPLGCSMESLVNYAAKTHAVAVRLDADERMHVHAPFGLSNIFAMRLVPNTALDNRKTHIEKGARMKVLWPELTVEPWPEA
ncbi:conserved hypothetical protein [Roseibium sp. TrichSKD4]|uniref:nucleotidyltransferase family protein n=1 Tax=Roseibium sp. TrichSKD4 TaxID=744980 RepID=UPI0001E5642F|nr:nucleotidyltransferase family protein [Roseibium sp. TrichSKD4]EFO33083.1 conserved hypothetical protein [Roseibium sp. TrichSKD4]